MAKHSKNKTSGGTLLLGLILVLSVLGGLVSIFMGKTANSEASQVTLPAAQEQPAEKTEEDNKAADEAQEKQDTQESETASEAHAADAPIVDEKGEKISFGQVPESTTNADPNEPDVTEASSAGTETPSAQTQVPDFIDTVTDDWLILVNKTHHLSKDYWPEDMVTVSSCIEGVGNADTKKLRKVAADALEELIKGAAEAGYQIKMRTGFRSYDYQVNLFASYVSNNGEEKANKFSARAGESEHQTGLCCDVSSPSVNWAISYEYGKTAEGKWLAEHCCEYGFIVRYLEGKDDITGYNYEPWHIRYVGVEAATEIYNKGICFEEYLGITD